MTYAQSSEFVRNLLGILHSGPKANAQYYAYAVEKIKEYKDRPEVIEYFEQEERREKHKARKVYFEEFRKRSLKFKKRPIK